MALRVQQEDWESLETAWTSLLALLPNASVFLTPVWQRAWWQHLGQGNLRLLSIRQGERVVGIAPLVQQDGHLGLLGSKDVVDYRDLLLEPGNEGPTLASLLDYLDRQDWRDLEIASLPDGSPALSLLPSLAQERGWSVRQAQEDVCPRIELPHTWDDYLASLTKKDRHELRRKLRRLTAADGVRHYVVQDPEGVAHGMDDFLQLMQASREDKSEFLTPQRAAFMRGMAISLAREGYLWLFFLEVAGVRVAATLCFFYRRQLSLYNSGYDPAYASLSVGLLLKALCIQEAIEQGADVFDFLRGAEPYKYDLGGVDHRLWQLTIDRSSA